MNPVEAKVVSRVTLGGDKLPLRVCKTCKKGFPPTKEYFRVNRAKWLRTECRSCDRDKRLIRVLAIKASATGDYSLPALWPRWSQDMRRRSPWEIDRRIVLANKARELNERKMGND